MGDGEARAYFAPLHRAPTIITSIFFAAFAAFECHGRGAMERSEISPGFPTSLPYVASLRRSRTQRA
jgi:hypothetical protein